MSDTPPPLKSQSDRRRSRSLWFHLHFWIGWIAALPIIVVCATGSVLIFEKQLHHWSHPEEFKLTPSGNPLSIAEVLEIYEKATPRLQVNHLGIPQNPQQAYGAYVIEFSEDGSKTGIRALVNPYTGELTRVQSKDSLSGWIIDLHRHLAAGKTGQMIIAISSLLLAITSLIGFILWWPMRGRTFVRAWKRGRALDWHNALGLIALLPLAIMAITGITFTWGDAVFPFLEKIQETPSRPARPSFDVPEGTPKVPVADVIRKVKELYPNYTLTGMQPSNHRPNPHAFFFKEGFDVFMNPYTGEQHSRFDRNRTGGGVVGAYRRNFGKFHTMGPYHISVRILWGLLSLAGAILAITGVWISIRRWQQKKRRKTFSTNLS